MKKRGETGLVRLPYVAKKRFPTKEYGQLKIPTKENCVGENKLGYQGKLI
jgi:hypothetical protein